MSEGREVGLSYHSATRSWPRCVAPPPGSPRARPHRGSVRPSSVIPPALRSGIRSLPHTNKKQIRGNYSYYLLFLFLNRKYKGNVGYTSALSQPCELRASSLTFWSWVRKSPRSSAPLLAPFLVATSSSVMTAGGRCTGVAHAANDPGVVSGNVTDDEDRACAGPWCVRSLVAPPRRLPPV